MDFTLKKTGLGKIKFPSDYSVNTIAQNYDKHVRIEGGVISVNSSALHPSFNNPATLTFEGVNCNAPYVYYSETATTKAAIFAENRLCLPPLCTNIQCGAGTFTVDVLHFTGYAVNGTANLTIDADDPKLVGESVIFTAEYRNFTDFIDGAICNISFSDGIFTMDEQTAHYNYSRTFSSAQTVEYNVTCSKSGENIVFANDTAVIQSAAIPEFSVITLVLGMLVVLSALYIIRRKKGENK